MTTPSGTSAGAASRGADTIPPVVKSIRVPWPVDRAFRRFTAGIAEWWPLATYSVGEEKAETVAFEDRVGGRLYETLEDGSQADWGRITVWEPPRRVAFTWHPGRPAETEQEVEVTFRPEGDGTRVDLVHTGWERIPEKPREMREGYDSGWDVVLQRYAEA